MDRQDFFEILSQKLDRFYNRFQSVQRLDNALLGHRKAHADPALTTGAERASRRKAQARLVDQLLCQLQAIRFALYMEEGLKS